MAGATDAATRSDFLHQAWNGIEHWSSVLGPPASIVGTVATVVAAWLAWWAVRKASQTAREADEALVRERQATFELGLLARIAELFALRSEAGTKSALDGLLLMLPAEDLPELRAYLTSITGITMPNNTPESVAQAVHQQLKTAVERRMASRRP
jgi:hypothetical protein